MAQGDPAPVHEGRRLDWRPRFDERSLDYPMAAGRVELPTRGRLWAHGKVLDQGAEGACFPAGTFVRMADGSQQAIEDVRTLDRVVTAEGRTGTVLQAMVRRASELVTVKLAGHVPIRCTPEHPFLTDRGYVPAAELTPVDLVAVTRYHAADSEPIDTGALVDLRGFRGTALGTVNTGGVDSEVSPPPALLPKTAELGRLIGLYAAEGHVTPNKVTWSLAGHELDTLAVEIVDLAKSALGAVPRIQVRPNGSVNVILYGKHWRLLFGALVPGTTKHGDKHLSAAVTSGPVDYLRGLLDGWLAGDGHYRRGGWSGTSVSRRLSLDMHAIATGLGERPSVAQAQPSLNRHAATRQVRYDLLFGTTGSSNSARQDEAAVWRRVRSVEAEPFDGWVHNLHVEGDESYVADGIGVHNCVGFGCAGEAAAEPVPVPKITNAVARAWYKRAQRDDAWPGEAYSGTSVLAGCLEGRRRGLYTGFRWATRAEQLAAGIVADGPAVIGVEWREGSYETDELGVLRPSGDVVGGHCLCVVGFVPSIEDRDGDLAHELEELDLLDGVLSVLEDGGTDNGVFIVLNSWGPTFGKRGLCVVPLSVMREWVHGGGEFAQPQGRKLPTGKEKAVALAQDEDEPPATESHDVTLHITAAEIQDRDRITDGLPENWPRESATVSWVRHVRGWGGRLVQVHTSIGMVPIGADRPVTVRRRQ